MSETVPERSGGNPWARKIGPIPMWAWAGILLGAAVIYSYIRSSKDQQSSDSTDSTDTGDESSQVPQFVNQDYVTVNPPAEPPVNITVPPDNPVTPPPKTTTPTQGKKPVGTLAAPGGIHATKVTSSGFTLAWNKVTGAQYYRLRVTYQDKLVHQQQNIHGTTATVTGLGADHTYTVHVATGNSAGLGQESNGPVVKTSR